MFGYNELAKIRTDKRASRKPISVGKYFINLFL